MTYLTFIIKATHVPIVTFFIFLSANNILVLRIIYVLLTAFKRPSILKHLLKPHVWLFILRPETFLSAACASLGAWVLLGRCSFLSESNHMRTGTTHSTEVSQSVSANDVALQ